MCLIFISASVTIGFDSTILRYSSISNGDIFCKAILWVFCVYVIRHFIQTVLVPNQVKVDQAILGNASVTGSGLLFTLNFYHQSFRANTNKYKLILFCWILNSNVISASPFSGSVTVSTNLSSRVILQGPL